MPQSMLRLVAGWDRTVIARKLAEAGASPEVIALVGKLPHGSGVGGGKGREKNCLRQRRFQERRRARKPAMGLSPAEQAKWERDLRVREWIMDIQRNLAENQKIAQLVIETILAPQGVPGRT